MKNILLAVVVLIIALLALIEFRYAIIIDSPVVAKFDRLTGKLWIVNSGVLSEIENEILPVTAEKKK